MQTCSCLSLSHPNVGWHLPQSSTSTQCTLSSLCLLCNGLPVEVYCFLACIEWKESSIIVSQINSKYKIPKGKGLQSFGEEKGREDMGTIYHFIFIVKHGEKWWPQSYIRPPFYARIRGHTRTSKEFPWLLLHARQHPLQTLLEKKKTQEAKVKRI